MRRIFTAVIALCLIAFQVMAEDSWLPDRRVIVSRDMDFFGSDIQALFDTDRVSCERLCLNNPDCKAFTFNARSNACFPKADVIDRKDYAGAISAEVVDASAEAKQRAAQRASEIAFLTPRDLQRSRDQASRLGFRHAGGKWPVDTLLNTVDVRLEAGDHVSAVQWAGAATAQSDLPEHWELYAVLSFEMVEKSGDDRTSRQYRDQALWATINTYLRADGERMRQRALIRMARVLEAKKRGRDMIRALRLAETFGENPEVTDLLSSAVGKYGFRIVDSEVTSDTAEPSICATFSEPLIRVGADYAPYVRLPDDRLAVTSSGDQICVRGVSHGGRYTVTFRSGLPAESGETLFKDISLTLYVRDRTPSVRFPGRAYVLPRTANAGLPIETVNLDVVDLKLRHISDRNLLRAIQDSYFGRPLSRYQEGRFSQEVAEDIWSGVAEVENTLNTDMITRLPMGEIIDDLPAGIYALSADVPDADPYDSAPATQWFVLSDIGLTTLKGSDGLHVFARGLGDAAPQEGLTVTLLSRANRVLATATTDDAGHALFGPGLVRGTAGAAPALVMAEAGDRDLAFLSLTDPAFDLSDRGVEGREPSGPLDVFLATDRGAYRAGDTIHATALVRDSQVRGVSDLPVTAILTRPDGVEYARHVSAAGSAGGHVFALPLSSSVPRGTWRVDIHGDVDAPALASSKVLVEDFIPERIDFDLNLPEGPILPTDPPLLKVEVAYLFGAPGADLPIEGDLLLKARRTLTEFPGYRFGQYDVSASTQYGGLGGEVVTDAMGLASVDLPLPDLELTDRPHEAELIVRVAEGSGRPVERRIRRAVASPGAMIGIKPLFEEVVPEGTEASFEIIAVGPDLGRVEMPVRWSLNRVSTRYQWYQLYGQWDWEPVTTRSEVASGTAMLGAESVKVTAPVDWGRYELVVERVDGDYLAASQDFYAGWYAPADASETPDTLELSLDKPGYRSGDTAYLRMVPRYAGTALVTVMSNRVIAMQAVEVSEGENMIPLEVTDEWGAGAYVTASVIRPVDLAGGQTPARALGLSYAKVDPGARALTVAIETDAESDPRGPLPATVRVEGVAPGETAFVTVAAVDVGILNLTGFKSPDPQDHYFGQRRLGMEIRDIYGRLIDGQSGAMGRLRSGGDALANSSLGDPPVSEELVAYFSGLVELDETGHAKVSFDIPEFNGTVRLMAVAWSPTAVGQAEAEVLVRDPVVVTASLPRFLAPGDSSRMLLEIVHAEGPAGDMALDLSALGLAMNTTGLPETVTLVDGGSVKLAVPITARSVGDHSITVALTTPDGKRLEKRLALGVRINDPAISATRRLSLAPRETFTLDENVFAGLRRPTAEVLVSAGPLARFDVPGLIATLQRYPYGCTEQVTSRAMPLLYLSSVIEAMELDDLPQIQERIEQSIERILTRQASNGAFGLWYPDTGDLWLDAYVSDFLSRARAQGYHVPERAFTAALDNLRNEIAYAADFDTGGEDLAYALMVLAREGHASVGDLRYYADEKAEAFGSALAQAQLGAALAHYGDQVRADSMFAHAAERISGQMRDEPSYWRADYGTNLRDAAGLLALAVESGSNAIDRNLLTARIGGTVREMSTQEKSWALLAAHAMVRDTSVSGLALDDEPVPGPFVRRVKASALQPMRLTNTTDLPTDITLTTIGVPEVAEPAGGYGYDIERSYYTMDGQLVSGPVTIGDRLVVVLTVRPAERTGARLMVDDPLPAGLEIDNPNLLRSGDIRALDWLDTDTARHAEFRSDRFLAAIDWQSSGALRLAYMVRAVSPGDFHHPAALVEDMYRPQYRAYTDTKWLIVVQP